MGKVMFKEPYLECQDGWKKLIDPLIETCRLADVEIRQIKEKFGGLRFYVGVGGSVDLHNAIDAAERQSYKVCEYCGEDGSPRWDLSWVKTLCDTHYAAVVAELDGLGDSE